MIEMSLGRVSSEKDVVVLGENWLRTASQVCEALGQGCPEGLQFFRRCKSAILMSLMMMKMMKTDDDDDDDTNSHEPGWGRVRFQKKNLYKCEHTSRQSSFWWQM